MYRLSFCFGFFPEEFVEALNSSFVPHLNVYSHSQFLQDGRRLCSAFKRTIFKIIRM